MIARSRAAITHYVNPHGPPSRDAPRRLDIIPWFTQDQLDAMRREPTVLPSYKRRRTDDESDPTVPWSPQYVEYLTNVKTKFVYEHLKYCTCPLRCNDGAPGLNPRWERRTTHSCRASSQLQLLTSLPTFRRSPPRRNHRPRHSTSRWR